MRQGKVLLRESQTFERRSTAAAWIENREESPARPGVLDALKTQPKSKKTPTLSDAIDRYVQESNKQIGRTKTQVLKSIKTFDIADKHCDAITSADIVEFAQEKLNGGVQPQTVSNYLAHLGAVFLSIPAQKGSVSRRNMGQFDRRLAAPWRVCFSYS
jgi:hypothetical protein